MGHLLETFVYYWICRFTPFLQDSIYDTSNTSFRLHYCLEYVYSISTTVLGHLHDIGTSDATASYNSNTLPLTATSTLSPDPLLLMSHPPFHNLRAAQPHPSLNTPLLHHAREALNASCSAARISSYDKSSSSKSSTTTGLDTWFPLCAAVVTLGFRVPNVSCPVNFE